MPRILTDEDKIKESRPRGRIGRKLVISFVLLVMLMVGGTGWVFIELTRRSLEQQMSDNLVAVANLTAASLNGNLVRRLRPGLEDFRLYKSMTTRLRRSQVLVGSRRIYVFNRRGESLLDTKEDIPIGRLYPRLKISDRLEVERTWQGESTHSVLFQEGHVFYMNGYAPLYDGEEVVAVVGVEIGAGFIGTLRVFEKSVYIFAAISALLTIILALGLARTITVPIGRLVRAAREIGQGNLQQVVDTSSNDELGYLGESMEEMRRKLMARDAELRQMLAGVAHEIRNPLGGIEIYAGLIADDLPDTDPRKQHIQKVIGEVRNLNKVITGFMDFARPTPPKPQWTSVSQLVDEAAFLLAPDLATADIDMKVDLRPDLMFYVDAEQLKRALFNLMKNAVQAMRQGGTLTVRSRSSDANVIIDVEDTGPGITSEVGQRLFEPFFTTREKGSGLGLAIVQRIIEANGGYIIVESNEGQGTLFQVSIPAGSEALIEENM